MPKLQEVNGRFSISVPKELIGMKGWKKGQELALVFNERGNIEIADVKK